KPTQRLACELWAAKPQASCGWSWSGFSASHHEANDRKDDASNQPDEPNAKLLPANQDRQIAVRRIDADEQNGERQRREQRNDQQSRLVVEARALGQIAKVGIGKRAEPVQDRQSNHYRDDGHEFRSFSASTPTPLPGTVRLCSSLCGLVRPDRLRALCPANRRGAMRALTGSRGQQLKKGVGRPFAADGRRRPVSADDRNIVRQGQELVPDRFEQLSLIAPREIGAPTEPANSTSPTIARRCAALRKTTLPG